MTFRTRLALVLFTASLLGGSATAYIGGFRGGGVRVGGFGGYRGGFSYGGYRGYSVPRYSMPSYSVPHYSAPRYAAPMRPTYNYAYRPSVYSRPAYLPATTATHPLWNPYGRTVTTVRPEVGRLGPAGRTLPETRLNRGTGLRVNEGWRPNVPARTTVARPLVRPSTVAANRALVAHNPYAANWTYPARNLVNPARFYNRPWGHYYPWYRGAWNRWRYWPSFWGGWGWGYGLGIAEGYALAGAYAGPSFVYDNPYYVPVPVAVPMDQPTIIESNTYVTPQEVDYARPIQVPTDAQVSSVDSDVVNQTKQIMSDAAAAFKRGDYSAAQREVDRAIHLLPDDTNLHEFRALCQFARGKYTDAAATLFAVLANGPGWDWNTLSSFYPDSDTYTRHLRALEAYVRNNPRDAAGHFVLAYQYLVLDDRKVAMGQFKRVVALQPRDKISAGILEALQKDQTNDRDESE